MKSEYASAKSYNIRKPLLTSDERLKRVGWTAFFVSLATIACVHLDQNLGNSPPEVDWSEIFGGGVGGNKTVRGVGPTTAGPMVRPKHSPMFKSSRLHREFSATIISRSSRLLLPTTTTFFSIWTLLNNSNPARRTRLLSEEDSVRPARAELLVLLRRGEGKGCHIDRRRDKPLIH